MKDFLTEMNPDGGVLSFRECPDWQGPKQPMYLEVKRVTFKKGSHYGLFGEALYDSSWSDANENEVITREDHPDYYLTHDYDCLMGELYGCEQDGLYEYLVELLCEQVEDVLDLDVPGPGLYKLKFVVDGYRNWEGEYDEWYETSIELVK